MHTHTHTHFAFTHLCILQSETWGKPSPQDSGLRRGTDRGPHLPSLLTTPATWPCLCLPYLLPFKQKHLARGHLTWGNPHPHLPPYAYIPRTPACPCSHTHYHLLFLPLCLPAFLALPFLPFLPSLSFSLPSLYTLHLLTYFSFYTYAFNFHFPHTCLFCLLNRETEVALTCIYCVHVYMSLPYLYLHAFTCLCTFAHTSPYTPFYYTLHIFTQRQRKDWFGRRGRNRAGEPRIEVRLSSSSRLMTLASSTFLSH